MEKILLHICCGVCSGAAIQVLQAEGKDVTGYFYNPNIYPADEYRKRLDVARDAAAMLGIPLIAGEYEAQAWEAAVAGLEQEPEGGSRCGICFSFRLKEACRKARELGIGQVATTLSISPHKDAQLINTLGLQIAADIYRVYNFKKKDGFKKTMEFARSHQLYCQHYCGCKFSMRHP